MKKLETKKKKKMSQIHVELVKFINRPALWAVMDQFFVDIDCFWIEGLLLIWSIKSCFSKQFQL